eukprot:CAMPEP_0176451138 /NCGR_PEP_ID=MMETSP0127-20121128/27625_1 /TAXON_ID=938130 /ORGANISM="Platyophrya macrostoma, Strain WH" /LENGTH=256 /DNA_ID=CAMNT_0017839071 /DNA_START=48 /DNA_END=818 /DNA_ORIENTATION=+
MMVQLGLSYGQKVIQEGEKGLSRYLPLIGDLRRYFRVDNQYVKNKLLMLVFPFNKQFNRKQFQFGDDLLGGNAFSSSSSSTMGPGAGTGAQQLPPVDDICAFDLYIPLMALITYVTICGFVRGINDGSLGPEFLASTLSSILFWVFLEVAVIKIFRYVLNLPQTFAALDIVSLCGYKYVGVCIMVLLRETLGLQQNRIFSTMLTCYFAGAAAFFALKAMTEFYIRDGKVPNQARPLVYGASALQIPFVLWFASRPF